MSDLRDFTGKNRKFTGTIGERISTGTTGERDTSTFGSGTLRFNSSTNLLEYYDGSAWREVRDLNNTITTQGDVLYRDASGLARLAAGSSGQFLKTNGSGSNPAWATVTTKIVNVTQTSINDGVNAGNRYRSPYHFSPLDTSVSVTSSSNYFLWTCTVPLSTSNHGAGAVEASENNSTWVNAYNKKNLAGTSIVQNNGSITWDTSYLGRYPHLVYDRNSDNLNNPSTATASGLYLPTGTPSTLYFRARFWSENGTENVALGGFAPDGGTTHGRVALSNMTIYEIAP